MKKFWGKPHGLLFAASAVIFAQFLSAVVCIYMQAIEYYDFAEWSFYIYMVYCLTVCAVSAVFIIKNRAESVRIWFSGFLLYAFCEILFFIKMITTAYNDISGFSFWGINSEISDSIYNLWDNQPLFKLYVCVSAIFLIYCVLFILEKKKLYISAAAVNLFLLGLFIIIMPSGEYLAIEPGAGIIDATTIEIIKEAGTLIFMLNTFIFAIYKFYTYKET